MLKYVFKKLNRGLQEAFNHSLKEIYFKKS